MGLKRRKIEPLNITDLHPNKQNTDFDGDGIDDSIDEEIAVKGAAPNTKKPKRGELNMKTLLNGLIKVGKRAFTKDGGGFLKITDFEGNIDGTAITAALVRLISIVVLGLIVWLLNSIGLPGEEIIQTGTEALEQAN